MTTPHRLELLGDRAGASTRSSPVPEDVRDVARSRAAEYLLRNAPDATSDDLHELLAMLDLLPAPRRPPR